MEKIKKSVALSLIFVLLISLFSINLSFANTFVDTGVHVEPSKAVNIKSTYPSNNAEEVEKNPAITFNFKDPIILKNKSKIKIIAKKDNDRVDIDRDASVSTSEDLIKIDKISLEENTEYKVILEVGAVALRNKKDEKGNEILNKQENLYFKTGTNDTLTKEDLIVEKYNSDISGTDQINYIDNTQLDSNGDIFINFNKDIYWNYNIIESDSNALNYFELVKKPLNDNESEDPEKDKGIQSVEIMKYKSKKNNKILKITPSKPLLNLNEYQIILKDKNILTSVNKEPLKHSIKQNIWTKALDDESIPNVDINFSSEDIKVDTSTTNKNSYVIEESFNYGIKKPMIIYIDKEVVEKPQEQGNALDGIELYINDRNNLEKQQLEIIDKYKLEHYVDNGIKKTKISIFPKDELISGKEYKLDIDKNTFVTRSNVSLDEVHFRYVIKEDINKSGIYETIIIVDGKSQTNEIFMDYLYTKTNDMNSKPEKKHVITFELKGSNFSKDIEKIVMTKVKEYERNEEEDISDQILATKKEISIPIKNVQFKSENVITGSFSEENLKELSDPSSLGTYKLKITFKDNKILESEPGSGEIVVTNRLCEKTPIAIDHFPIKNSKDVDYTTLDYVEVSFIDIYDDVKKLWNEKSSTKDGFKVNEVNGFDMRDYNKPIEISKSKGKITYKIYIRKSLLTEGMKYKVEVPKSILSCKNGFGLHNNSIEIWEFSTMDRSLSNNIYEGSIPEDYQTDYPIVLEDDYFHRGSKVYFENMITGYRVSADRVVFSGNSSQNKDKLYVYLPKSPKLKAGLYNIIIDNGFFNDKFKYDVFSVVKNGINVPNEKERDKDSIDSNIENIKEIIKTSKNEMELKAIYKGTTIKLDEIVGEEVLTRDIKFKGKSLPLLKTESKWSNVKLRGLNKITQSNDMTIRLGRAEPQIQDIVKKKLKGYVIKSDFIIIGGENYIAHKIDLTIPFKESKLNNLKLMRYDEESRRVYEIKLSKNNINITDKVINVEAINKGIFVIVE